MRRVRLLVLAAFFVLSGCATVQPPSDARRIFDAKPLVPEEWYKRLYREVQECLGKQGPPFEWIEWYVVPAGNMGDDGGLWSYPNRLYIDERFVIHFGILKHELVHYADQGSGTHSPPGFAMTAFDEMFIRCAGL